MQLKKKESDEGDEVKGLESKWAEQTWRNYYIHFFHPSATGEAILSSFVSYGCTLSCGLDG
jgi:hypothetical protein